MGESASTRRSAGGRLPERMGGLPSRTGASFRELSGGDGQPLVVHPTPAGAEPSVAGLCDALRHASAWVRERLVTA
jgi:hypothetical protein